MLPIDSNIDHYNFLNTHIWNHPYISREVLIGNLPLGGMQPIRIQSMTNTDTMDTVRTVEQCMRLADAGCEYIRITAPNAKDAENLWNIKNELHKKKYTTPLIADIHFHPKAAEIAAGIIEKVRINPGNYCDRNTGKFNFTEEEYISALSRIEERILPLIEICKRHHTVMRIGTNHGSLSERIISRYGNTAEGMVASALEFVEICRKSDFHDIVLSMKASNVKVMITATRLLVTEMQRLGWDYPIHLGVTEAGSDDEGRIKSAAGIGTLLQDGIGDTIRVSLTEAPEKEIPVAKQIADYHGKRKDIVKQDRVKESIEIKGNAYTHRETFEVQNIAKNHVPVVLSCQKSEQADYYFIGKNQISDNLNNIYPVFDTWEQFLGCTEKHSSLNFVCISSPEISIREIIPHVVFLLDFTNSKSIAEERNLIFSWIKNKISNPVICIKRYPFHNFEKLQLQASSGFAALLVDGLIEGIGIDAPFEANTLTELSFNILQATGVRISKTEYIACPSCGRTQYDIESSLKAIKTQTSHLKGLKIGVMGCIVNGPGEMADADYGYVGESNGKITLYKGKQPVRRNIPEQEAIQALIDLIKENGDWQEETANA